ncbi:hypothetical protein PIB30_095223, partial [Stylosanthes scabra]|nr:hypothetical protein [Stylosanthes scabra]
MPTPVTPPHRHLPYIVIYVIDHRIYTISPLTLSKWFTDLHSQKQPCPHGRNRQHRFTEYTKPRIKDHHYNYISLYLRAAISGDLWLGSGNSDDSNDEVRWLQLVVM